MLFIGIFTFEPEKRNEIIKRRLEKGMMIPAGMSVLGEFLALKGHLVFYLFETDNPDAFYGFFPQWSDLMRCDLLPVMSVGARFEELMKQ